MPRSRPWIAALSAVALLFSLAIGPLLGTARAQEQVELRVWDQFTDAERIRRRRRDLRRLHGGEPEHHDPPRGHSDRADAATRSTPPSPPAPDRTSSSTTPVRATPACWPMPACSLPLDDYAAQYGWNERIAASALRGDHDRRHALRPAAAGRPDRHVLQQDAARPGRADGSRDPRRAARLLRRGDGEGLHPDRFRQQPGLGGVPPVLDDRQPDDRPGGDARSSCSSNAGKLGHPGDRRPRSRPSSSTLRDAGCFPEDANAITYDDGNALFYTGQSLLHTTGSWLVSDIEDEHARLPRSGSCRSRRSKAATADSGSPASARPTSSPPTAAPGRGGDVPRLPLLAGGGRALGRRGPLHRPGRSSTPPPSRLAALPASILDTLQSAGLRGERSSATTSTCWRRRRSTT